MTLDDGTAPEHLGDVLSALVDGELSTPERDLAERHLASCPACRAELALTARSRELVARLSPLDPPAELLAAMLAGESRRPRALMWFGAAAAIVGLSVLAASPAQHRVTAQQARTVAFTTIPVATGAARPAVRTSGLVAPFLAPSQLAGGYGLVSVLRRNGTLQVLYSDGVHALLVFEEGGVLDKGGLRSAGQTVALGSVRGVSYSWPGGHVLTWQSGAATYTVVGDGSADDVLAAARSLPPARQLAVTQRVRLTSRRMLEELTGGR
jgi:anti-sigma factor RsiW